MCETLPQTSQEYPVRIAVTCCRRGPHGKWSWIMGDHEPSWFQHAVFYEIFPDRFARGAQKRDIIVDTATLEPWDAAPTAWGYKGGDLWGVIDRLDYLEELGINAIYFTPIFQSTANHRYHTYDYYQIDPLLGGNDAFAELLKAAHRRDIRNYHRRCIQSLWPRFLFF